MTGEEMERTLDVIIRNVAAQHESFAAHQAVTDIWRSIIEEKNREFTKKVRKLEAEIESLKNQNDYLFDKVIKLEAESRMILDLGQPN